MAEIGGRALGAVVGRGAVIIGKSAGYRAGPIIMEVADLIGKRPIVAVVVPVMACVGQARRQDRRDEEGSGR